MKVEFDKTKFCCCPFPSERQGLGCRGMCQQCGTEIFQGYRHGIDDPPKMTAAKPQPRQFWIFPEASGFIGTIQKEKITDFSGWGYLRADLQVHVIEYRAFQELEKELVEVKEHASDAKALREQRGVDMKKIRELTAALEANISKEIQCPICKSCGENECCPAELCKYPNEKLKAELEAAKAENVLLNKRLEKAKEFINQISLRELDSVNVIKRIYLMKELEAIK